MSHPSKRKGNSFEREVVNTAKEYGLDSQRAYASNGLALGEHEECDLKIEDYRVQAKRRKSIAKYITPNTEVVDVQVVREDYGEALVVMPLHMFLNFVKLEKEYR